MTKGNTTWTYTYDASGMRTKRTNGMDTYTYIYNGSKLVRLIVDTNELFDLSFTYDANGTPLTVTERGETYYYVTNLQGDVIGIKDSSGNQVVSYAYDAWGKLLYRTNTQLADYNPLRYRGYVYDWETGLYYLQSRYYNPEWGRFINGDGLVTTWQGFTGNNMFAYCLNNPTNCADPTGDIGGWIIIPIIIGLIPLLSGCSDSPTSDFGSAKPFEKMSGSPNKNDPNCYAYAVGAPNNIQPGQISGRYPTDFSDVEDVAKSVEADMKKMNFTVRRIKGPNSLVYENEFKIALRVGTSFVPGKDFYDYHFMRQTDTGQWAEKHGYGGSAVLWDVGKTPDDISWTLGEKGPDYYDSEIIYFAIGR